MSAVTTSVGHAPGTAGPRRELPVIGSSERALFRRCRRKWAWGGSLRGNLEPAGHPIGNFWLGTGVHYALEMFHGYRPFATTVEGLLAYAGAFRDDERPDDWRDLILTGVGILDYYERHWLPRRDEFRTVWLPTPTPDFAHGATVELPGGASGPAPVPQVEVRFTVPLPHTDAVYGGTFDRLATDSLGRYWIVDYKTAKRFDTAKLPLDPQVSAYCWAATQIYGVRFEGMVYQQFLKTPPAPPKMLKNGQLSKAKDQPTTYALYKAALIERFGGVPDEYADYLAALAARETPEGDQFIRIDLVRRNEAQMRAEGWKIMAEAREMLDPELPLYPNPTFQCAFDCHFREPCIEVDSGGDAEYLLKTAYRPRRELTGWRERIAAGDYERIDLDALRADDEPLNLIWDDDPAPDSPFF